MTILDTPNTGDAAHNDLIYTVEDAHAADPVTYPNYKYIADIYVNGVMVARLKKVPDPTNNIGVFNFSPVVRNYVRSTFNPALTLPAQELGRGEFYIDIQIKFGEEYSYTSYYDIEVSDEIKVFNNYNKQLYGADTSLYGKEDKVASNAPSILEAYLQQENLFLTYLPTNTSSVTFDIVANDGGTHADTFTPSTAYFAQLLNISPQALNLLSPGLITANTESYTVLIGEETYTVKLVCEPRFETYELHFLNQYGGYDTVLFNKVSRLNVNAQKSSFEKLPYTIGDDGIPTYYNSNAVYNEVRYTYASQFTEKITLNSDFLTDAEYRWLYDLIVSPQVYMFKDNYFIPVTVTDNNYEVKKRVNDQLTNLTITIDPGKTYNTQYR